MCYSVFAKRENPIAPKAGRFFGAAKIDKLFESQILLFGFLILRPKWQYRQSGNEGLL